MFLEGAEYRSVGVSERWRSGALEDWSSKAQWLLEWRTRIAVVLGSECRATLTGSECRATLTILFPEQVTALKSRLDVGLFGSPVGDAFVIAAQ